MNAFSYHKKLVGNNISAIANDINTIGNTTSVISYHKSGVGNCIAPIGFPIL